MKSFVLLVVTLICLAHAEQQTVKGAKVYDIALANVEQVKFLQAYDGKVGFDFWKHEDKLSRVMVNANEQNQFIHLLIQNNIEFKVHIENVEQYLLEEQTHRLATKKHKPEGFISFDQYYTYEEIDAYLVRLAKDYPKLVTLIEVGTTHEGRPLRALRISKGNEGTKPVMFVDAGIHAREWIAPAVALFVIHQLVEQTEQHDELLDMVDWIVWPVINADGYAYTHINSTTRLWRKNRKPTSNANCIGIDLNRNCNETFGGQGSSNDPCSTTYRGPAAFSELETSALRDILRKDINIKCYLSFHSVATVILYPWGSTSQLPPNWKTLHEIGDEISAAIKDVGGTNYRVGTAQSLMYYASGISQDYAYASGIDISYTIELSGTGFELPPEFIEEVVVEVFEGVKVLAKRIYDMYGKPST